ncbi:unnamed protein product [Ectocarpus sp. CCAP 1310/34]|nr:unnamed protein product [Ectocarpus sp. CCAP 1310/34]
MEDYETSDHFTRRIKMSKDIGRGVLLSAEARAALSSLDNFMSHQNPTSGEFSLDLVLEKCLDLTFPQKARKLFLDKTNAYVKHCATAPPPGEEDKRKPHQMKKSTTLGGVTLGEPSEERNTYGIVGGGMKGDPKLRPYMDCPLGRTTRHVLHVLLGECGVLRQKIDGSEVFIAMDNYFTSLTLFECLASHDIFAVGTCRADRTAGADAYLETLGRTIPNRGDMNFCRSWQVACVQWTDSKDIFLISTIHVAQPAKGKEEAGGIGGGFGRPTERALTNAFPIFRKWVELLIREVEAKKPIAPGGELEELELASTELATLSKVERAVWDEQMATLLMAKCNVARPNKGGRRPASDNKPADPVWGSVTLKSGRLCLNPTCKTRSTKGCSCKQFCTRGDKSGVLMCETCWKSPESHEQAAKAYWDGVAKGRNRKGFEWQRGSVETAG